MASQFLKSHAKLFDKELEIDYLQFLNQNTKLSFQVSFHTNLSRPKSFSRSIIIFASEMQTK